MMYIMKKCKKWSINDERKRKQERKREKGERRKGKGKGRGKEERKYFFSSAPLTNFHVQSTIFKILAPAAGSSTSSLRSEKNPPGRWVFSFTAPRGAEATTGCYATFVEKIPTKPETPI